MQTETRGDGGEIPGTSDIAVVRTTLPAPRNVAEHGARRLVLTECACGGCRLMKELGPSCRRKPNAKERHQATAERLLVRAQRLELARLAHVGLAGLAPLDSPLDHLFHGVPLE